MTQFLHGRCLSQPWVFRKFNLNPIKIPENEVGLPWWKISFRCLLVAGAPQVLIAVIWKFVHIFVEVLLKSKLFLFFSLLSLTSWEANEKPKFFFCTLTKTNYKAWKVSYAASHTDNSPKTHTAVFCYLVWTWTVPTVTNYLPEIKESQQNFSQPSVFHTGKDTYQNWIDFWETRLYYGGYLRLSSNLCSLSPWRPTLHTVQFTAVWFLKLWFSRGFSWPHCPDF